jgi:hypothetical protein
MNRPYVTYPGRDYSGEPYSVKFYLREDVTGLTFDDDVQWMNDFMTLLGEATLGAWLGLDAVTEVYVDAASLPTSPYAQRESRVILNCVDSVTGRPHDVGIPCPDLSKMAIAGTDATSVLDADVLAYTVALQTMAVSPEKNPLIVRSGKITGVPS